MMPKRECPALKSPSTGTEFGEPGEHHPEMQQTDEGETFPFQADVDGFLHADCTRISKKGGDFSFQVDIGVNLETTETTAVQVTARQKCARLPMSQQQRGVIASSTEQNKQFDLGG